MPHRAVLAIAALTAPVVLTLGASPAAAATAVVGQGAFVQVAPFVDGTLLTFTCSAAAPGAQSTSIDSCTLANSQYVVDAAPAASSQGPAAVTQETVAVPVTAYRVCWTATGHGGDGTTTTVSGCTAFADRAGAA